MIKFVKVRVRANELVLGYKGEYCAFVHRPYNERSPEARLAYDLLKADMIIKGMLNPIITYNNHVLIGMRRFEIIVSIDGEYTWVDCYNILDDVSQWKRIDIKKLEEFKTIMYGNTPNFIG